MKTIEVKSSIDSWLRIKHFAFFLLIPVALLLSSCMSSNVQVYGGIDSSDKTITVPIGNHLLIGALKQQLQKSGWKLVVDKGPVRTVGTLGKETDIKTGNSFRTRYRLLISQSQFDYCGLIGGSPAINYDLSLIDNATGGEVITQSGPDCESRAVNKFIAALKDAEVK
jgi:hypothetical protein